MEQRQVEAALSVLEAALIAGDGASAYLACAGVLLELLECCYREDGLPIPSRDALFAGLGGTRLGEKFLPNLEAYARLCIRLDGVCPGKAPALFPQLGDGRRLLARMAAFNLKG